MCGWFSGGGVDKKVNPNEVAVNLLNYTDIYGNRSLEINNSRSFMKVTCPENKIKKCDLQKGDLVFTPSSETIDEIGLSALVDEDLKETVYSYHVIRFRFTKSIHHKYKKYLCNNNFVLGQFSKLCKGTTRQILGATEFSAIRILLPPLPEQQAIADFLDRRTSEIDELIAKKERVIELLREKRTALISHAVTKGLNPDAKMKDSRIDWLGNIPEHWEVVKLKYLAAIKYGLGQPPKEMADGLPLLRATNVERGKINPKGLVYVDPSDIPYERDPVLKTNDIIVVRSGAYTGDSAIVPPEYEGAITGYDMVVRARTANSMFVAYSILGTCVQSQIDLCRLRAAQPHLNAEELGGCLLVVPSKDIQHQIVTYLDARTTEFDVLIARVTEAIEKLKEYRTALIFAAVTGKIDVR